MCNKTKLRLLHNKVSTLLKKALRELQKGAVQTSSSLDNRFVTAGYLLTEAQEYANSAWQLLRTGNARASLTVTRWILEASLNLQWVTAEPNEVDDRLRLLLAEAYRQKAVRHKGLADLYPDDRLEQLKQADISQQLERELLGEDSRLKPLGTRIESLADRFDAKNVPNPYSLYRICCAAAHPSLEVWRRYNEVSNGRPKSTSPPNSTPIAVYLAAAATFHLIGGSYCLADLGNPDTLDRWWVEQISPLLPK